MENKILENLKNVESAQKNRKWMKSIFKGIKSVGQNSKGSEQFTYYE